MTSCLNMNNLFRYSIVYKIYSSNDSCPKYQFYLNVVVLYLRFSLPGVPRAGKTGLI